MTQHTPTPWEVSDFDYARVQCASRGEEICDTLYATEKTPEENLANAAFIVKSANHHEALVEALRDLLDWSDHGAEGFKGDPVGLLDNLKHRMNKARGVISAIEETK